MIIRSLRIATLPVLAALACLATVSLGCGDTVDVGANRPDNLGASGSAGTSGGGGVGGTSGVGGTTGSSGSSGGNGCDTGIEPAFCLPKCQSNADCGNGTFCDKSSAISCGAEGICVGKPDACTLECAEPGFCGCDGKLHCSQCQANTQGVSISPDASFCQGNQPSGCTSNAQCDANAYCDFGASSACGVAGTCTVKADVCDASCASPMLCGCDGKTYCSACVAGGQGVSIDPTGAACGGGSNGKQACGGASSPACAADEFCDFASGTDAPATCGGKNEDTGVCTKRPENCTEECASPKLCGCDGKLYCNACSAQGAGTSISADTSICPAQLAHRDSSFGDARTRKRTGRRSVGARTKRDRLP